MNEANDRKIKELIGNHDNVEKNLKRQCSIDTLKIRNDTDVELATLTKEHATDRDRLINDQ